MIDEKDIEPNMDELEAQAIAEAEAEAQAAADEEARLAAEEADGDEPEQPGDEPPVDLKSISREDLLKLRPDLAEAFTPKVETPAEKPADPRAEFHQRYAADYAAIAEEPDYIKAEQLRAELTLKQQADIQEAQRLAQATSNRDTYVAEMLTEVAGDDEDAKAYVQSHLKDFNAQTIAYMHSNPKQKALLRDLADAARYRKLQAEAPEGKRTTAPSITRPTNGASRPPANDPVESAQVEFLLAEGLAKDKAEAIQMARAGR
jgi:hypothetical protein